MADREQLPVVANLHYANGVYLQELEEAQRTGKCLFCDHEKLSDPEYFCFEFGGWVARKNKFPTRDRDGEFPAHHFLLIPERHVRDWWDLSRKDHDAINSLLGMLSAEYEVDGGGLFNRSGEPALSGATILHFHLHFVVPRVVDGTTIPVYMPVG